MQIGNIISFFNILQTIRSRMKTCHRLYAVIFSEHRRQCIYNGGKQRNCCIQYIIAKNEPIPLSIRIIPRISIHRSFRRMAENWWRGIGRRVF